MHRTMPVCQIATIGATHEWIQKGLYKYPTDLLILVTTQEFQEATNKVRELNEEMTIEVKTAEEPRELLYLINFFRKIILDTKERGYDVIINVTSGLTSWQLTFYLVATMLEEQVKKLYIFDKELRIPIELMLYRPLSKAEERIVKVISKEGSSLTDIVQEYKKLHRQDKGSKGLVSRYLKDLIVKGCVHSPTVSQEKRYFLTQKGRIYAIFKKESRKD